MSKKQKVETKRHAQGARDVWEGETKALAAPQDAKKVDWERVPTDVLARVVMTFLRVAETAQLRGTQTRLAFLPAGAITLPVGACCTHCLTLVCRWWK